ncbi:MAG: hypothetical protein AVDCRST_MAG69-1962 [uncultured Solirubrobacteraceae bacterium]|uniref:Uncharacterized protein n=1 Tax=uncultured Solirubrobacteraceae bacterium TaxID=1162706 RepID=A0A6J4SNK5_9ACTN|nr:MAG: hypothetical protein AVDCRST_MAG69-1962 [uncultured Solirubrobacteraceae bacterium]
MPRRPAGTVGTGSGRHHLRHDEDGDAAFNGMNVHWPGGVLVNLGAADILVAWV